MMGRLEFLVLVFFVGLGANAQMGPEIYRLSPDREPRSISFENPTGEKGRGGMASSNLGVGRKGAPAKTLDPGETIVLCDIEGSGVIRHLWMTTRNQPENLRSLVLRAFWEGQEHPSIECPLGDFMGFAHGTLGDYESAVHSVGEMAGMNFWLPMPFAKRARLTLSNERDARTRLYYQVDYTLEALAETEDLGRLHVSFRREDPTTLGRDFEILSKRNGNGRFLGCVLGVRVLDSTWWGEGEVKVYLDGDTEYPTLCGTGTEDYVGLSWGMQETPYRYHGCNLNREGFVSAYRWHILDPIEWKREIRITIQQLGWAPDGYVERQDDWSAAAFWYEPVPSAPLPPFPASEALRIDLPLPDPLPKKIGNISPLEAIHLAEQKVRDLDASEVSVDEELGFARYWVYGEVGGKKAEVLVDAEHARVLAANIEDEGNYRWPGVLISAHRGAVKFAPENTLAAIEKAIELGADIIEMDIRETSDGELVLCHDSTLDRTTDGTGPVSATTLSEIEKLDAGSWFSEDFKGERIPTLREALESLKGRARPDLDFKAGDPEKLVKLLMELGFEEGVSLYCNDLAYRERFRDLFPSIELRPMLPSPNHLDQLVTEWDPAIVNVEWRDLSPELVRRIHLSGRLAFVNTHSRHDTRFKIESAIEAGADIIQADSLDLLVEELSKRGLRPGKESEVDN
jgi:glycerophosphoryl diester phosphodiesterase